MVGTWDAQLGSREMRLEWESLPSMHNALPSILSIKKKRKKEKGTEGSTNHGLQDSGKGKK